MTPARNSQENDEVAHEDAPSSIAAAVPSDGCMLRSRGVLGGRASPDRAELPGSRYRARRAPNQAWSRHTNQRSAKFPIVQRVRRICGHRSDEDIRQPQHHLVRDVKRNPKENDDRRPAPAPRGALPSADQLGLSLDAVGKNQPRSPGHGMTMQTRLAFRSGVRGCGAYVTPHVVPGGHGPALSGRLTTWNSTR
jgi:hypothetical protein